LRRVNRSRRSVSRICDYGGGRGGGNLGGRVLNNQSFSKYRLFCEKKVSKFDVFFTKWGNDEKADIFFRAV
jgi:uncharacterized membrane protein YebE (DUF533 family)